MSLARIALALVLFAPALARADERPPLPPDASTPALAKGGGDRIQQYVVARAVDKVLAQEVKLLKDGGWTLVKDDKAPTADAIRLEAKKTKTGPVWKLSVFGDKDRTTIIVTAPAPRQ